MMCIIVDFDDTIYNFSEAIKKTLFHMITFSKLNYEEAKEFMFDIKKYYVSLFSRINLEGSNNDYKINYDFLHAAFDYYNIFSTLLKKYSGSVITKLEYDTFFLKNCIVFPEILDLIIKISQCNYPIIIISDGLYEDKIKLLKHWNIEHLFYDIITSDKTKQLKPGTAFWKAIQEKTNFKDYQYIYIGNHISDYTFAQNHNIKFYAYNADESLKTQLNTDTSIAELYNL